MTKIMTVRIEDDLNDEINAVARADDVPVSEVIRAALTHYVAVRGADPRFQTRLCELLAKDTKVVQRMAGGGSM
jgi:Arc/MetJ-type ribon-helix-helix transcriptional regulator